MQVSTGTCGPELGWLRTLEETGWLSPFLTKVAQGTPRGSVLPETVGTGRHLEGGQALRASALWGRTARKACGGGRSRLAKGFSLNQLYPR